ncbi:hypothetical protein PU629_06515 [Pullulanibacillus sp. KACC 23026]|uniref:hypothetical protein n=1 Tax=Pullulanibacillus sp. KACC 23026 TaxID=3028315 RepID=UPI0023AFB45D|nr:hypothetical protein [Pullulanibacillus sp. KACC 23026]WEG14018.1 hypothetical protein PU629_06515 [Pullulanibacillus sp. KACC 23026]
MDNKFKNMLNLCEDLQELANIREVNGSYSDLCFSCDLILRNMIMILDLKSSGKDFDEEYRYLKNNLLAAYNRMTSEEIETIAKKYNMSIY